MMWDTCWAVLVIMLFGSPVMVALVAYEVTQALAQLKRFA
jgi:hypothetical protein